MEYTKYKDISNESYIFLEIGWQLLTAIKSWYRSSSLSYTEIVVCVEYTGSPAARYRDCSVKKRVSQ